MRDDGSRPPLEAQRLDPRRDSQFFQTIHPPARPGDPDFAQHMRRARRKDEYPVGQRDRLIDIMRHEQCNHLAAFDEPGEIAAQLPGQWRIERNEGFIEQ